MRGSVIRNLLTNLCHLIILLHAVKEHGGLIELIYLSYYRTVRDFNRKLLKL